ncbi:MAG: low specificity L-threonine aldolase, partial [Nitratireductor sp.]
MNFSSDNTAGAHPKISENIAKHSLGFASSYGASDLDKKVDAQLSEIFEKDVSAFFVATGTAANSLCLAATAKPGGITFCHEEAHIIMDECGAPEFFSNGSRLVPLAGREGKIDLEALSAKFEEFDPSFVHYGRPSAVSITQATEIGSVYKLDEIEAICDVAHKNDVRAHMDGARFANALVGHGCTPAQMTWKAGIDYLSFGGTKNGCWCAEALICFNDNMSEELAFLRKRSGQLFSKSRFIAAQFEAYLADGLWLELAKNANDAAQMLG